MRKVIGKSKKFTKLVTEVAKECAISDTVYETLKASARSCTNSKQTTVWSVSVRKHWQNTTNVYRGTSFGFHRLEEALAGVVIGDRANVDYQFDFKCNPNLLLCFVEEKLKARPDFNDAINYMQPFLPKPKLKRECKIKPWPKRKLIKEIQVLLKSDQPEEALTQVANLLRVLVLHKDSTVSDITEALVGSTITPEIIIALVVGTEIESTIKDRQLKTSSALTTMLLSNSQHVLTLKRRSK